MSSKRRIVGFITSQRIGGHWRIYLLETQFWEEKKHVSLGIIKNGIFVLWYVKVRAILLYFMLKRLFSQNQLQMVSYSKLHLVLSPRLFPLIFWYPWLIAVVCWSLGSLRLSTIVKFLSHWTYPTMVIAFSYVRSCTMKPWRYHVGPKREYLGSDTMIKERMLDGYKNKQKTICYGGQSPICTTTTGYSPHV